MTDSLRLMCADILERTPRRGVIPQIRALHAAATLRYAERFEYGDPVPAAEHASALDEYEECLAGLEQEIEQANREGRAQSKAFEAFEKAIVESLRTTSDGTALADAWHAYRAAVK